MGLKALFLAALEKLGLKERALQRTRDDLPACAQAFANSLREDGQLCDAFRHLVDAEPLRRLEIVSNWLEGCQTLAPVERERLCSYLSNEEGFESLLLELETENHAARSAAAQGPSATRLAS